MGQPGERVRYGAEATFAVAVRRLLTARSAEGFGSWRITFPAAAGVLVQWGVS